MSEETTQEVREETTAPAPNPVLALAADVLYERRNVEPLAALLPVLAPEALLGLAGRPYEADFLELVEAEEVAERVVRIRGAR